MSAYKVEGIRCAYQCYRKPSMWPFRRFRSFRELERGDSTFICEIVTSNVRDSHSVMYGDVVEYDMGNRYSRLAIVYIVGPALTFRRRQDYAERVRYAPIHTHSWLCLDIDNQHYYTYDNLEIWGLGETRPSDVFSDVPHY